MVKKPLRITRSKAGLVVVDIQERLLPAILENERLVQNTVRVIKGATILGLPIFATEQYRKGIGPDFRASRGGHAWLCADRKVHFQCLRSERFRRGAEGQEDLRHHPLRHGGARVYFTDVPRYARGWIQGVRGSGRYLLAR